MRHAMRSRVGSVLASSGLLAEAAASGGEPGGHGTDQQRSCTPASEFITGSSVRRPGHNRCCIDGRRTARSLRYRWQHQMTAARGEVLRLEGVQ